LFTLICSFHSPCSSRSVVFVFFSFIYFAAAAPAAFARLSAGLDETLVRIIPARPGLAPVREAMAALTPSLIRAASTPPGPVAA